MGEPGIFVACEDPLDDLLPGNGAKQVPVGTVECDHFMVRIHLEGFSRMP